jgi:hypothetical protein
LRCAADWTQRRFCRRCALRDVAVGVERLIEHRDDEHGAGGRAPGWCCGDSLPIARGNRATVGPGAEP